MDRLSCSRSCHPVLANQVHLILYTAVTMLLPTVRSAAQGSRLSAAHVTTLHERLLNMAAWFRVHARRITMPMPIGAPSKAEGRYVRIRLHATL